METDDTDCLGDSTQTQFLFIVSVSFESAHGITCEPGRPGRGEELDQVVFSAAWSADCAVMVGVKIVVAEG